MWDFAEALQCLNHPKDEDLSLGTPASETRAALILCRSDMGTRRVILKTYRYKVSHLRHNEAVSKVGHPAWRIVNPGLRSETWATLIYFGFDMDQLQSVGDYQDAG